MSMAIGLEFAEDVDGEGVPSRKVPLKRWDRFRVVANVSGPSMTKQEFSDECDINNIMKRYEKRGVVSHFNAHQGQYGDFIDAPEFQVAQNALIEAQAMFMSLPAKVRRDFDNDPAKFLAFAQDEANLDRLVDYGLAIRPPEPEPAVPAPSPAPPGAPVGGGGG